MTDRAKTNAQRQAKLKARRLAAGLGPVTIWALPDERRLIREYAEKLAAKRAKLAAPRAG